MEYHLNLYKDSEGNTIRPLISLDILASYLEFYLLNFYTVTILVSLIETVSAGLLKPKSLKEKVYICIYSGNNFINSIDYTKLSNKHFILY